MENFNELFYDFQQELKSISSNLSHLEKKCDLLIQERNRLMERIMSAGDQPYLKGYHESAPATLTVNPLIRLLIKSKKALTGNQLVRNTIDAYPDFIPLQIINEKSYVQRVLKHLIAEKQIVELTDKYSVARLYALPEWLDEHGELNPAYSSK